MLTCFHRFTGTPRRFFATVILLGVILSTATPALARPDQQTGSAEITGSPLRIQVSSDGGVQVYHEKYVMGASYGTFGSGFYIVIEQTAYGPILNSFSSAYPTELISQDGPDGNGSKGNPYRVVTEQQLNTEGSVLNVVHTVSYEEGNNYFQQDWRITNQQGGRICMKAYHAADVYFADDDLGIGYYDSGTGSVGGSNQSQDWFMVFTPLTSANHHMEDSYRLVFDHVQTGTDLSDTTNPDYLDNGIALQWDICLGNGDSKTVSDLWSFGESKAEVIAPGGETGGFRPSDTLTPELTTHIPTPLDISLDPKVIGSNFLLAALAMILFTIASEILNRTLAKNEAIVQRILFPLKWMRQLMQSVGISNYIGHPAWFELSKLFVIMLIYGLIFSLLDRSWRPLSLTGLYLFFSMTVAFGIVGLADDIVQWFAARRWKVATSLNLRPGNLLMAMASAGFSRAFGLIPGIMFGMPEAFDIDPAALDRRRENTLARLAALILLLIGLVAWVPTLLTALLLRGSLPGFIQDLMGGMESLLLLVFAVTVQSIFLHMLAFRGTFGLALRRWSFLVWFFFLGVITFVFFHTLINPKGDLVKALSSANVRFFFITIGLFTLFAFSVWAFFLGLELLRASSQSQSTPPQPSQAEPAAPIQATDTPSPPDTELNDLITTWNTATPTQRDASLQRLGAYGEAVIDPLVGYLQSPDPTARLVATTALHRTHSQRAIEPLQQALNDPDGNVRAMARFALDDLARSFPVPPSPTPAIPPVARRTSVWVWVIVLAALLLCACVATVIGVLVLKSI